MRKFLRFFLNLIPNQSVMTVLSGQLKGKKWIKGSGVNGYWLGTYESNKQKIFQSIIKPGQTVYDIGAHSGFYTLLASSLVGREGLVVAIEPLPLNLNFLIRHIELNQCANVKVISCAVSDTNQLNYFDPNISVFTGFVTKSPKTLMVQTVSLDNLVENNHIPPPNIIKIDVEGAESEVLKGCVRILEKFHPIIILATHSRELRNNCSDLLRSSNYKLEKIGNDEGEILAIPNLVSS